MVVRTLRSIRVPRGFLAVLCRFRQYLRGVPGGGGVVFVRPVQEVSALCASEPDGLLGAFAAAPMDVHLDHAACPASERPGEDPIACLRFEISTLHHDADWHDGIALGDIRFTLQTDHGELMYVRSQEYATAVRRFLPASVAARKSTRVNMCSVLQRGSRRLRPISTG